MSFQNIKVIDGVAVLAGATNDPVTVKMDDSLNEILIYVINAGDSTNLTVKIYSSPDGIIQAPLSTLTLSTTAAVADVPVSIVPAYLIFVASNGDATNATTYDVIISKRA